MLSHLWLRRKGNMSRLPWLPQWTLHREHCPLHTAHGWLLTAMGMFSDYKTKCIFRQGCIRMPSQIKYAEDSDWKIKVEETNLFGLCTCFFIILIGIYNHSSVYILIFVFVNYCISGPREKGNISRLPSPPPLSPVCICLLGTTYYLSLP